MSDLSLFEKLDLRLNRTRNPVTRANKRSILNKFFEVVGRKESYDEYDVMKFLEWAEQHYRGSSIQQVYQVIKWFYKIFGFDFGDIPPSEIDYGSMNNVPLDKEAIKRMILAKPFYDTITRGLLALSTIYGMRAKEMHSLGPADIKEDRIYVRTAKSGRDTWRWMFVPEEIRGVLLEFRDYLEGRSIPRVAVFQAFHKAIKIAGIKNVPQRAGWHTIRRRLIIELTKTGLPDNIIIRFMRWKRKDAVSNILYRYRQSEPDEELMESVDKKVMEVHPFLKWWKL